MKWQSLQVVAAASAGLQIVSLKLSYLLLTFISRDSAPTGFNNRVLERFGADGLKSPQKVILLWFRESSFPNLWAGTLSGEPSDRPRDTGAGRTERSVSMASKLT